MGTYNCDRRESIAWKENHSWGTFGPPPSWGTCSDHEGCRGTWLLPKVPSRLPVLPRSYAHRDSSV
jgi:hypothetical protein